MRLVGDRQLLAGFGVRPVEDGSEFLVVVGREPIELEMIASLDVRLTFGNAVGRDPRRGEQLHQIGAREILERSGVGDLVDARTDEQVARERLRGRVLDHLVDLQLDLLRSLASSRRGNQAARRHLETAVHEIGRYLTGESQHVSCAIDADALANHQPDTLLSTRKIPYALTSSYADLEQNLPPRALGWFLGANPIPLLAPCHRVIGGLETLAAYVGGRDRRRWLLENERRNADSAEPAAPPPETDPAR
jgi:O-6-methylguanine DNA methyltransferase